MTAKERTGHYLNRITDANGELWISAYKLEVMLNNIQTEAILEEREACAQVAETYNCYCGCGKVVALAIRARSEAAPKSTNPPPDEL